jgi:type I restriction enzyme S subunit
VSRRKEVDTAVQQAEIRGIPRNWKVAPLGDYLVAIEAGKSFKCEEHPPSKKQIGVIKISAVTWGEYQEEESKTCVNPDFVDARLFIANDDFLFSRANTIELVGACVIAKGVTKKVMLSDKILRLHFKGISPKYVLHFLRSRMGRSQIEALSTGNQESMRNIGQERIKRINLPVPPPGEELVIVNKIEALLSELDKGIEALKTVREQLKVYRQAVLKHAFEGKLTARSRTKNASSNWKESSLGALLAYVTSGSRGWADYYAASGDIFIRAQNLKHDRLDLSDAAYVQLPEKSEGMRTRVQPGDVLVTITGANVTKTGVVPDEIRTAYVSQHVALCRPTAALDPTFLYWYLIAEAAGRKQLNAFAYGAGKPGLNLDNIRSVRIPLPDLPAQREIVRVISELLSIERQLDDRLIAQQQRSEALRQAIFKSAFSGQLAAQLPVETSASPTMEIEA